MKKGSRTPQKNSRKIHRKTGRPHKPYRTSWGEHVEGLRQRKDGRWVVVETGQTFVELDEKLAVHRFRQWQRSQEHVSTVRMSVPFSTFKSKDDRDEAMQAGASIWGMIDGTVRIGAEIPEVLAWAWLREELYERPEYVAKQVGIPEIAYLTELKKPEPSLTLREIGKLYHDKADVQSKQRRQIQLFWDDFRKFMERHEVETLRQLTTAAVAEYGDFAKDRARKLREAKVRGGSLKYLKHRYNGIRRAINFARQRGVNPDDVRHAIDCCAVLTVPRHRSLRDPHPIAREDFHRLLDHVTEPRMRALLLVMLNLCMYPHEARNLDWGEINLDKKTVVTDRSKTTVIRIGTLWEQTIEALRAIRPANPASDLQVFTTREHTRWSVKTIGNQYRRLRSQAGVSKSVKLEHLRDGAYTAAIDAGASVDDAKLLAGHSTGISDFYVARKPRMVAKWIEGIRQAYFD